MKLAFASGKGGTGKTTVAVNLAYHLAAHHPVQYLDCDVEEPNGHLFLRPDTDGKQPVEVTIPVVDHSRCDYCGACSAHCQFKAIVSLPSATMVFRELCHSCGVCVRVCPKGAISEQQREVGYIEQGKAVRGIEFVHGVLMVGEPIASRVIRELKRYYRTGCIKLIDAPPGTSCPVVTAIADTDLVILVTEPTPFGLHDLKVAVTVCRTMEKKLGVVVNRAKGEFPPLDHYLCAEEIPLLMTLPEDRKIAEVYSRGEIILESLPQYHSNFVELAENIERLAN